MASVFGHSFSVFLNFVRHCFICRPSDITLCQRTLGLKPGLLRFWQWQSDALTTRLDLILTRIDLILTRLELIVPRLDLILTRLDLILTGLGLILPRLDLILGFEHISPIFWKNHREMHLLTGGRDHISKTSRHRKNCDFIFWLCVCIS